MSNEPEHWKDIPDHEKEKILRLARMDDQRFEFMMQSGASIEWW